MTQPIPHVYIGWDPHEDLAYGAARTSLLDHTPKVIVDRLTLSDLRRQKLYTRPTEQRNGQLWDEISGAPMSTEHAISRFLVPRLCGYIGWALFVDGDVLFRRDVRDLFALADDRYAVMCVQHPPLLDTSPKKEGQVQQIYHRKNWSSVVLWNCGHFTNRGLTLSMINELPGRELHAFGWVPENEMGALPPEWNYLVGVNPPMDNPAIVHYTLGTPAMPAYAKSSFADEWYAAARRGAKI